MRNSSSGRRATTTWRLIGSRSSIPRHHLLKLIAEASETVRAKLKAAHPETQAEIDGAVSRSRRTRKTARPPATSTSSAARAHVEKLHEAQKLDEALVAQFARDSKFNETNAAMACLTNVPFVTVETMMIESRSEGVMVLAKVLDFSWATVKAILDMRGGLPSNDEAFTKVSYERLKPSTAQQVLRFTRCSNSRPPRRRNHAAARLLSPFPPKA